MWVSELMETAGLLHKERQGGLCSWHQAQGRDRGESPPLWLRKAVPGGCPCARAGAGVGTQALVILVSHLASPQYVPLLFGAAESVCQGKQC